MKTFLTLFLFICVLSCNKSKVIKTSKDQNIKILNSYLTKIKNKEISPKSKILLNKKSFEILKIQSNTSNNRELLKSIVNNFYELNDWNNFFLSSKLLYRNSLKSKDSLNIILSSRYIGNYFYEKKILDSSYYYFLKSKKISSKLNDNNNLAVAFLKIGIVKQDINDFFGSDLALQNALIIFRNSTDYNKKYVVLNQLGLVATELKNYDKGIEYHKEALDNVVKYNLQSIYHEESVCYNNIGYLFLKKSDFNQAINNFNLGLKDSNIKLDDPVLYSLLIDNLAYAKLKLKKYSNVPQLFQNALKIRDSLKDSDAIIRTNIHLSEYYQVINDSIFSIRYSKKALQLARDSKNPFNIVLTLKQAAAVDKKNASAYTSDYIRISDSLQDVERKNLDRFARIQLETDELIKENIFLTEKNKRILYSIFAFGSIVLILGYSRTQFLKNKYLLLEQSQQRANENLYRLVISEQDSIEQGKNLEKKRIAKELHDGVLGRLFGLRLNLDMLNSRDDDQVSKDRKSFLNELQLIEQDIREISHELSREKIELINNFLSLTNALFENQAKIGKAKLNIAIDDNINWDLLSNSTRINLYRILQETLQNVNKYAKAKNITISFKKDSYGNLILSIFDNGIGFNVDEKSKGIGLTNVFSRVNDSNGTIVINSAKKQGTSILIVIPLESKTIKF